MNKELAKHGKIVPHVILIIGYIFGNVPRHALQIIIGQIIILGFVINVMRPVLRAMEVILIIV